MTASHPMTIKIYFMLTTPALVRAIKPTDIAPLMHQLKQWRRVQWRISLEDIATTLQTRPGVLVEDGVGLRGFMLLEPHVAGYGLICGLGLRDTWGINPYFHHVLPPLIQWARREQLTALMGMGNEDWFVKGLVAQEFKIRHWVIALERVGTALPPPVATVGQIRPAQLADLTTILRIDEQTFDQMWRINSHELQRALRKSGEVLLIEMNGQAVGYAWFEVSQSHAHVTRLVVQPEYHGRGLGAQLLAQVMNQALAQGITLLSVNTLSQNDRSRALYERFGFGFTGEQMPILWRELGSEK